MRCQWLREFIVDVTFCRKLLKKHKSRSDILMYESRVTYCGKTSCNERLARTTSVCRRLEDSPGHTLRSMSAHGVSGRLWLLRLEDDDRERWELDGQLVRPHVPAGFFGLDAGEVADVGAAVEFAVAVEDLLVPAAAGDADDVLLPHDRGEVTGDDQDVVGILSRAD